MPIKNIDIENSWINLFDEVIDDQMKRGFTRKEAEEILDRSLEEFLNKERAIRFDVNKELAGE